VSSVFTKIINKEIPADIIYEDSDLIAFNDINPQAPVHFLVVPKKEIPTLNDIKEEDRPLIGKMFCVAKNIAMEMGVDATGYRAIFNCNEDGGQTVFHIHLHIIGGKKLPFSM